MYTFLDIYDILTWTQIVHDYVFDSFECHSHNLISAMFSIFGSCIKKVIKLHAHFTNIP